MQKNKIDAHVGAQMHKRRVQISMQLDKMARHLGVSVKEIEQFESGSSRIDAERLLAIARLLGVQPSYFFEGLYDTPSVSQMHGGPVGLSPQGARELVQLITAFLSINDEQTRKHIIALTVIASKTRGYPNIDGNDVTYSD